MRKIFGLLSLLMTIYTGNAQEAETPMITNESDFPAAIHNGVPNIQIPLFEVDTNNNQFNLNFTMRYDLASAASKRLSTGYLGGVWSLDVFGSVIRNSGSPETGGFRYVSDEEYYEYETSIDETRVKAGSDLFSFNTPTGISGKFRLKREGNSLKVDIQRASENIDIDIDYSSIPSPDTDYGRRFRIDQFTVKDINGYKYTYSNYDSVKIRKTNLIIGTVDRYFRTHYYITSITDKFNKDILTYQYSTENNHDLPRLIPEKIIVHDKGYISILKDISNMVIEKRSDNDELIQKVVIPNGWSREAIIPYVRKFGKNDVTPDIYKMEYTTYTHPSGDNMSCFEEFDKSKYWIDQHPSGIIKKMTTPSGASTFYHFEANDINAGDETAFVHGGSLYKTMMDRYYENPANFEFEPVTYSYNSSLNRYYFSADSTFYYNYDASKLYEATNPWTGMIQFDDNVRLYRETTVGSGNFQLLEHNSNPATLIKCINYPYSYNYNATQPRSFYLGVIDDDTDQVLSQVEIARVKPKPYSELDMRIQVRGLRLKKKVTFDKDISSFTYETGNYDPPAEEIIFEYNDFDNPGKSSGDIGSKSEEDIRLWGFVFYKNVRIKKNGIGYTEYTFDRGNNYGSTSNVFSQNKSINVYPIKVERFSESGQLIESSTFERTYIPNHNHDHAECGNRCDYVVDVSYEKVTATVYVPGSTTKKLTTVTESSFDTITRHLTHRKITDVRLAQTFEEEHQYQKLGNAYYQTAVKKYKNGTMINQSKAEYAPINSGTLANVYALKKTSVAKATQPFETEKEITKRDNKGNILEYKTKEGLYVSQIWGYNDTKVVAELKNQRYNQIASGTIATIKNNSKASSYNETSLTAALNGLRTTYPNAFITTYTYIPMVGLKTTTDANGRKETYQYDNFNRLYRVLNHEGNVVKEYNYNIKN